MARKGVLSDVSIKEHYPEMFPLDIGLQQALFTHKLEGSKFSKPSKKLKNPSDIARFPIYDIKNFARLSTPSQGVETSFLGILNYRDKIGSSNVPANIANGYKEQKEQVYTPRVPRDIKTERLFIEEVKTTTSGTLSIGTLPRNRGFVEFNKKFGDAKGYLNAQTKGMLMNLGDDGTVRQLVDTLFPKPLGGKRIPHNEALATLQRAYPKGSEEQEIIARANKASMAQNALPSREAFGNMIVDAFGRFQVMSAEERFENEVDELLEQQAEAMEQAEALVNPDERN